MVKFHCFIKPCPLIKSFLLILKYQFIVSTLYLFCLLQLQGTLIAPQSTSWADDTLDTWIQFSGVDNLILDGDGKFDGQGSIWWQSCKKKTIFVSTGSYITICTIL